MTTLSSPPSPRSPFVLLSVLLCTALLWSCKIERITNTIESVVPFWTAINGPVDSTGTPLGGNDLTVSRDNHLFVTTILPNLPDNGSSVPNAVYRSMDGGQHWGKISLPSDMASGELPGAIQTGAVGELYLTVYSLPALQNAGYQYSLFHSTDEGTHWTEIGMPRSYVYQAFKVLASGMLVAQFQGKVVNSVDNGLTWNIVSTGSSDTVSTIWVGPNDGLYAQVYSGNILRSLDQGASWTRMGSGLPSSPSKGDNTYIHSMAFLNDGGIVAGFAWHGSGDEDSGFGAYRSEDGGATWLPCGNGMPNYEAISSVAAGPSNTVIATGYRGIYRSDDRGKTWMKAFGMDASVSCVAPDGYAYSLTNLNPNDGETYAFLKSVEPMK